MKLDGLPDLIDFKDICVDGVFENADGGKIVQFSFDRPFASGAKAPYTGFYYSPDGIPAAYQNVDLPLTETGEGTWSWSDGTDNHGTTASLGNGWFNFEAWF